MRTFINTTQDATIYQRYPEHNTGLDEILEVGKVLKNLDGSKMYASASARILVDLSIPSEQQYPSGANYFLNLRIANAKNVNRYQKLEIYPVSKSWIEGSGYFYQDVKNVEDGVSWVSASNQDAWQTQGGDYISNSVSASYTFSEFPIQDVKVNVTDIIAPIVDGSNSIPWNGLLIKFPTSDELNEKNFGNIKFFSGNTHTIFSPKLEIVWKEQTFITGSLKKLINSNVSVIPKNLKESYTLGEIDKIYLVVRDPFPDKRFDSTQRYRTTYYLPSSSYFRLKDTVSGVTIYEFDQYSEINCDTSGSYFILDTSGLEVNRYYSVDLKIKADNLVFYPEFEYTFKVDPND